MPIQRHYMLSSHGVDVGMVYNLPKHVRVIMHCKPGKEVSAEDFNEARTWYVASKTYHDKKGAYLKDLRIVDEGSKRARQFCVFSGDHVKEDLNRLPDLMLEDEDVDFRTGVYQLPVRFTRVFLRDREEGGKFYRAGDKEDLDPKTFNTLLEPYTRKGAKLKKGSLFSYLLEPGGLANKKYKDLQFVVVPTSRYHHSYAEMKRQGRIVLQDKKYRVGVNVKLHDTSAYNTKIKSEQTKLKRIKKDGVMLSDVIRFLCNKHKGEPITLVVSACRSFDPKLPQHVRQNQCATARCSINCFLKKYV